MRDLLTGLLIVVFVAGFCAFFLLDSVLRFSSDSQRVVDVARAADVRGTLVEAASQVAAAELERQGGSVSPTALRAPIADVVSQDWFDDSLRGAHAALVTALDEGKTTAVYNLRPVADELGRSIDVLARRAASECELFLGSAACRNRVRANEAIAQQRYRAHNLVDRLPAQVDLLDLLRRSRDGRRLIEFEEVRKRIGDLRTLRWLGLCLLVGCVALIALLNLGSWSRLSAAVGSALVAGAAVYLVAGYVARGPLGERALARLDELWASRSGLDASAQTLVAGVERLTLEVLDASTRGSTSTVAIIGAVGLGLVLIGALARGR